MQNGGWTIVLVIIALGILTGFMVSTNIDLNQKAKEGYAALVISEERHATANAQVTLSASEVEKYKTEIANVYATATAEKNDKQKMNNVLSTAEVKIHRQETAMAAIGNHTPVAGGNASRPTIVGAVRTTLIPKTPVPVTGGLSWLPALALGFFVIVVAAAYRMLKIEDQQQSQAR